MTPRPPSLTSVPALLATFQNEWDAIALERFSLREQLARTREELSTALYQLDGATRVVERLSRERDQAREALSKVTVIASTTNGDAMAMDNEALPANLVEKVEETQAKYVRSCRMETVLTRAYLNDDYCRLSKSRKKRPIPEGWATADDVVSFQTVATNSLPVPQASSASVEKGYAAISGLEGDVAIYSIEACAVERTLKVDEPVTDTIWSGSRVILATSNGSVKVIDNGEEVASFSEHVGPATSVSIHPSGEILASVGSDKNIVFYDLKALSRVSRVYTDSCKRSIFQYLCWRSTSY